MKDFSAKCNPHRKRFQHTQKNSIQWVKLMKDWLINIFFAHSIKFQHLSRKKITEWMHHSFPQYILLWTKLCPSKIICWSSKPQCDGIWIWAFGRQLGLGEVMRVGPSWWDSCPCKKKRRHRLSLCAHTKEGPMRKWALTRDCDHAGSLDFQPPDPWEMNICCFSHPVCGLLL